MFIVWLENKPAYELFCWLSTQMRQGFNGEYGLDYNVLYRRLDHLLARTLINVTQYDYLIEDVRVLEYAHLDELQRIKQLKQETKP